MSDCKYNHEQLEAYHDGELDAGARAEVERHLESCEGCSSILMGIEATSRLFTEAEPIRLSQIGMARLHANLELLTDRGLLRLARVMTGLAASVLVVGSLWLVRSHPPAQANAASAPLVAMLDESASVSAVDPGPADWVVTELAR